jgi:hypothetical protein
MMTFDTLLTQQIITRRQRETAERDNSKFRMSDAGKCHLMRYWKRQGKPMTPATDDNGYRTMELGIMIHDLLQTILKEAAAEHDFNIVTEGLLEDAHRLGHYDMLLQFEHKMVLYDIKTISGKQAWYMTNRDDSAKRQHIHQILTYASFIPFASTGYPETRLVYINRENLEVVSDREIIYDDSLLDQDWLPLIDAWEHQTEPRANPEHWKCKYCPYFADCEQRPPF